MSWAEEQALRIRQNQEEEQKAREWQIHRSALLTRDSRSLWDALGDRINSEIESLKKLVPNTEHLRVYPTHSNGLVIETVVQPIIKIQVTFDGSQGYVNATVIRQRGFKFDQKTIGRFSIDVDPYAGVTFNGADGRAESVQHVTEAILGPLGDFFSGDRHPTVTCRVVG